MANWATTSYVIEGPKDILQKILEATIKAVNTGDDRYEEYKICDYLSIQYEEGKTCLGGIIEEEPYMDEKALYIHAEERWGLQDFNKLLESKFPEIKVYWSVEEPGDEVYATNDKEGKYFPERFYVETCIDDVYNFEYFRFKSDVFKWLYKITGGRVNTEEKLAAFNSDYEDSDAKDENYIYIHKFNVMD